MKNYLPSKKFIYSIIVIAILGVLFFVISNLISKKNHFSATKENSLQTTGLTINDMVKKDSDLDGVADWEEALWGTDINNTATFDGLADATYIKQKKDILKITSGYDETNSQDLTETDKFAQEFFTSLAAMKQSGQVDAKTINSVSNALGQKLVDPTIIDKYSTGDARVGTGDGIDKQKAYYITIKKIFETYSKKGLGDEVEITSILAGSSENGDQTKNIEKLTEIAKAYQGFASEVIKTSVPQSLVSYHIKIANSANNTGISVKNMTKVMNDPIVGLSGLSQYQKYSDELISNVGDLENLLYNN